MATETATPFETLALQGALQHLDTQTKLLLAIHERLRGTPQQRTPFRVKIPSLHTTKDVTNAVPVVTASRGEIKGLHNTLSTPATVTLIEANTGETILSVELAANSYVAAFVPFFERVFATSGTGVVVTGHAYE